MLVAQAVVTLERPERWAKQLRDHLAHRCAVDDEPEGAVVHFDAGDGVISANDWAVLLSARAETELQVAEVQRILADHLERMAAKLAVQVVWGEAAQLD